MREEGVGVEPELWVPADRLLPIMARYRGLVDRLRPGTQRKWALLRAGDQGFVSLEAVDRILIEMDLDIWLRIPEKDGGLADIYFDGKQYGKPDRNNHRRYKTTGERLEARRESWRRNQARRDVKVEVVCPSCQVPRQVGADYATRLIKLKSGVCRSCAQLEVKKLWDDHRAAA